MDTVPDPMVVLNDCRQIVYANRAFKKLMGTEQGRKVAGLRPGEAVGCVLSDLHKDGCGASDSCLNCGVVVAALNSLSGIPDTQETLIHLKRGDTLDLQVWTTPFHHEEHRFLLFCFVDRMGQERRRVLERLFFHDLLNRKGDLQDIADILGEKEPQKKRAEGFARTVFSLSATLMDEIEAQRDLTAAETGILALHGEEIGSLEFVEDLAQAFRHHRAARDKAVVVVHPSAERVFHSDRGVVRRTLGHLLKNALQASQPGETVTLTCLPQEATITFEIHNPAYIARSEQAQVFQRVSTRTGLTRLGTYSARLVIEKFLGGTVSFTTHRRKGTVFLVQLPLSPRG